MLNITNKIFEYNFINVQNISVVDTIRHKILNRLGLGFKEENKMSKNKIQVPEAKQAMEQFKMEAANEVGVNLKQGYNGDLTAKQAGSIGRSNG